MATAALLRDPRAVRLSNQLRAQSAALAQRGVTNIQPAYIDEVADQLLDAGIDDIRSITGETTIELRPPPSQLSFIGTEGESQIQWGNYPITRLFIRGVEWPITEGERAAWYHDGDNDLFPVGVTGDGKFFIVLRWFEQPGAAVAFLTPVIQRSTWRNLAVVAGFIAAFAGVPAIIGEAVLGAEMAAAYPVASKAIGQIALRTVLTGGDVESAVRSAATSLVGGEFGDLVGTAIDSEVIGVAAGAATEAALQGEDARKAVITSLITQGGTIVSELFPGDPTDYDPGEYVYLPGGDDLVTLEPGDLTLDDLGLSFDLDAVLANLEVPEALTLPLDAILPDDDGNLFGVDGFYVELSDRGYIGAIYPDEQGNIRAPDNNILMPADEVFKYLETPAELAEQLRIRIEPLQGEPIAPLTAPNLRPINIPPPAAQTRTPVIDWAKQADALLKVAVSIGGSIKSIANGTFRPGYATSPYGTVRPQVGIPVRQADGSVVVNNGNGTQTVRYPDGRVTTMPSMYSSTGMAGNYGASLIPGVPNTALLIGGGLVVAALLLSRR